MYNASAFWKLLAHRRTSFVKIGTLLNRVFLCNLKTHRLWWYILKIDRDLIWQCAEYIGAWSCNSANLSSSEYARVAMATAIISPWLLWMCNSSSMFFFQRGAPVFQISAFHISSQENPLTHFGNNNLFFCPFPLRFSDGTLFHWWYAAEHLLKYAQSICCACLNAIFYFLLCNWRFLIH